MTPDEFAKRFAVLRAHYPNAQITDEQAEVYWQDLGRLPIETLEGAFREAWQTSEFFPSVAMILRIVVDARIPSIEALVESVFSGGMDGIAERGLQLFGGREELGNRKIEDRAFTRKELARCMETARDEAMKEMRATITRGIGVEKRLQIERE